MIPKSKSSILIIDDDPDFINLFKKMFQKSEDYNIVHAKDGMEGILKSRNQEFKYIFTDYNMPKVSGDEFIHTVRRGHYNQETPIIIVTASKDKVQKSMEQFENTLLIGKPINIKEIKTILKQSSSEFVSKKSQVDTEFINKAVSNFKEILTNIGNFQNITKQTTKKIDPTQHHDYDYYGCIIINSEKFNGIITVAFPENTFEEYIVECIDNSIIQSNDQIFETFIQTLITKTKKMLTNEGDPVHEINSVFGIGHTELLSSRESILEFYTSFTSNKGPFFVQVSIWD